MIGEWSLLLFLFGVLRIWGFLAHLGFLFPVVLVGVQTWSLSGHFIHGLGGFTGSTCGSLGMGFAGSSVPPAECLLRLWLFSGGLGVSGAMGGLWVCSAWSLWYTGLG